MNANGLRCKVGDLAFCGAGSRITQNQGKVVTVVERARDLSGGPAWRVRSAGSPLAYTDDFGNVHEATECRAADHALTPICPGKPMKARRVRSTVEA